MATPVPVSRPPLAFVDRARDPEIRHDRVPLIQQDVLRLDVPVNHCLAMRVLERDPSTSTDDPQLRRRRQAALLAIEPVAQRLSLDVRHHVDTASPFTLARVEQREDVRMVELRGELDLHAGNRSAPSEAASSGRRTLIATRRSCFRSKAR